MEINENMRERLLQFYQVDIREAKMFFSTQNYAFIFPEKPYMIRVSITTQKTRREILSELMWLDDLKSFASTICEPSPSVRGNLLEEFELDGVLYRASMFRTARGTVKSIAQMNPMFFLCVGELLGKIHHVSTDEQEIGIRFVRRTLAENFDGRLQASREKIPPKILENIQRIARQVEDMPAEAGQYGLCHGDFHTQNFFVEHNNIWVFDFDSCCYASYLYDVASFIQACLLHGYRAGEDMRKVVFQDILPWFRIGYEMNHKMEESVWEQLETVIAYRTAYTYLALAQIDEFGASGDLDQFKQFFTFILSQDNVMDAMTLIRQRRKA